MKTQCLPLRAADGVDVSACDRRTRRADGGRASSPWIGLCGLLLCTAADASPWQQAFFSPLTNALPPARGLAVDEIGHVHVQAFNRGPQGSDYTMFHAYTMAADGSVPWIWGLSPVEGMSDCGVYARGGQRLDCVRRGGGSSTYPVLEMRSRHGSDVVWQAALPPESIVRDASIPSEDSALVVIERDAAGLREIVVQRFENGVPETLAATPACPFAAQSLIGSVFRMPVDANGRIHHVRACRNGFGSVELAHESFDATLGVWSQLSVQTIFQGGIEQIALSPDGLAFALVQENRQRMLWASADAPGPWSPHAFDFDGKVAFFAAGAQGLVVAGYSPAPDSAEALCGLGLDMVGWFDLDTGLSAQWIPVSALSDAAPLGFALTDTGELVFVGKYGQGASQDVVQVVYRSGQSKEIGLLELAANEASVGSAHVQWMPSTDGQGPGVVVARNVARADAFGGQSLGVRVDQLPLPSP